MITRGYFIGQIIDDLTDLAGQVEMRCQLGLTDLNIHLENFYKDILSPLYQANFRNLNEFRSNEPGLDLGDKRKRVAFQVTSNKKGAKINDTLAKVTDDQLAIYDSIYILIVRAKQGSYGSLNQKDMKRCRFTKKHILDYRDICAKLMSAETADLERIHDICKRETARVRIDLEIPDEKGVYPTNVASLAERLPKPNIGSGEKLYDYMVKEVIAEEESPESIMTTLEAVSGRLQRLPRITRDAFAVMLERRDGSDGGAGYTPWINADKLDRFFSAYDIHGEIRILREDGFVDYDEPEHDNISGRLSFYLPDTFDGFLSVFLNYTRENGIALTKPLVALDFSDF